MTDQCDANQAGPARHACQSEHPATAVAEEAVCTITDLPAECLHLVCQHMEDDETKTAAMRTCHVLRAAVLESYMALLRVQFGNETDSGPDDEENQESVEVDLQQQRQELWQHAQVLRQAQQVSVVFEFKQNTEQWKGRALMLNWLSEMFQQCKGPLLSVTSLTVENRIVPVGCLSSWLQIYFPNVTHLTSRAEAGRHERCDTTLLVSRVYCNLTSIDFGLNFEFDATGHIAALLDAPHLTHVTLRHYDFCRHDFSNRACKWETLHLTSWVSLPMLARLPLQNVKQLVLGSAQQGHQITCATDCITKKVLEHECMQLLRNACEFIAEHADVTLSTNSGLALSCFNTPVTDAALALQLLKHARPHNMSHDKASGTLKINGLERITLEFVRLLCNALPPTITRVVLSKDIGCVFEKGVLEQLVTLLPLHVSGFTIIQCYDQVQWTAVKTACEHATRAIDLVVPSSDRVYTFKSSNDPTPESSLDM